MKRQMNNACKLALGKIRNIKKQTVNQKIRQIIYTLLSVLLTLGCGSGENKYPEPSQETADTAFVSKVGVFSYDSEEFVADYGTIIVPENRFSEASRLIHLPVIRIHARSKNPREPIFCLAGGPGASNMEWLPIDTLLTDHDFVMVGYRGVDGSSVLNCPEVKEALMEEENPLSKESLLRIGKAWEASAARFKSQGTDLDGYTIPQSIEDMEAARRIFKYDRINLLSESYGTRLAYIYGLMYPEIINRSVMIAANPPGHFMWDAQKVDEQIDYYARLWSKDSVNNKESSDLSETMLKVLKNMPDHWFFLAINPGKVKVTTFCMLFHRNTAAMVFDAFVSAEQGDYSGIALLSLAYDYVLPSLFVWGDLATKAISVDFDPTINYSVETDRTDTILGSPLNKLLWGPLSHGHLPIKMIPEDLRTLQYSDVETLLLSGSLDFSTPAEYATDELLPYLRNGKQIILSEYGHVHDLRYLNQQMTDEIIMNYINNGTQKTSKLKYVPMDFNVSLGLPEVIKIAFGLFVLVLISLILAMYWLFRKIKHKRLKRSLLNAVALCNN